MDSIGIILLHTCTYIYIYIYIYHNNIYIYIYIYIYYIRYAKEILDSYCEKPISTGPLRPRAPVAISTFCIYQLFHIAYRLFLWNPDRNMLSVFMGWESMLWACCCSAILVSHAVAVRFLDWVSMLSTCSPWIYFDKRLVLDGVKTAQRHWTLCFVKWSDRIGRIGRAIVIAIGYCQ